MAGGAVTPDLSVVVPAYRNAGSLEELGRRIRDTLDGAGFVFEVVVVDDASPDNTHAAAGRLAARDPAVRVIALAHNVGQQRAIFTGLRAAHGRVVAVMDADLQDPPEALPLLVDTLRRGSYQAVFAGRRGRYESRARLGTSALFKGLLHLLTGVPRDAGAYVVMAHTLTDRLCAMRGEDPNLVAMIGCTGARVTSIPVERAPRLDGTSAYTSMMRLSVGARAIRHTLTTWRAG